MDQLFNKINYEIKKNRFVLLCNLNNHERAVHINKYIDTIKIVLKSAYKNKRVVRFIRWYTIYIYIFYLFICFSIYNTVEKFYIYNNVFNYYIYYI